VCVCVVCVYVVSVCVVYGVCVCVALSIRQANPIFCELYYIVSGSLSGYDKLVFFHCISQAARFLRGEVIEHKMRAFRSALFWGFYASPEGTAILLCVKYQNGAKLIYCEAKVRSHVCILIRCITFVWNMWHSNKNSSRYKKCKNVFMQSSRYSSHVSVKLVLFSIGFSKNSQTSNFMKIRQVADGLFHSDRLGRQAGRQADGRTNWPTDKHNEANSRLSQFYERA
jgi:hypothetical protein